MLVNAIFGGETRQPEIRLRSQATKSPRAGNIAKTMTTEGTNSSLFPHLLTGFAREQSVTEGGVMLS